MANVAFFVLQRRLATIRGSSRATRQRTQGAVFAPRRKGRKGMQISHKAHKGTKKEFRAMRQTSRKATHRAGPILEATNNRRMCRYVCYEPQRRQELPTSSESSCSGKILMDSEAKECLYQI
jgi:hypothetical protein